MTYGTAMVAFSAMAILAVTIWMIWQFLLFLYDFKFIRDVIEETRIANQIHPEEDNLKLEFGDMTKVETSKKEEGSVKSESEDDDEVSRKFNED